jgi:hypothetical protein
MDLSEPGWSAWRWTPEPVEAGAEDRLPGSLSCAKAASVIRREGKGSGRTMTELPDEDDDRYMHRLAATMFRQLASSGDPDDLMPALFAARHLLDWEAGGAPDEAETEAFARSFPAWGTIDAVCDGLRPIWYESGEAFVEHAGTDQPLVALCLGFLDDYALSRFEGEDDDAPRAEGAAAPRPAERRPSRS